MSQTARTHYQAMAIMRGAIDEASRLQRILGDVTRQIKRIEVDGKPNENLLNKAGTMKADISALIQSMNDMITSSDTLSVKGE